MHILRAEGLEKKIKSLEIVKGMSLEVKSGEVVGLLGPNGAGKTTTFYMICGLVEATAGEVFFDDENISKKPLHERALQGIGYLPQEASIFKDLSVEDNLMVAAQVSIKGKENQEKRILELLDMFNIEPIRYRKGVSLSGGERRRVEIARALVCFLMSLLQGLTPLLLWIYKRLSNSLFRMTLGYLSQIIMFVRL